MQTTTKSLEGLFDKLTDTMLEQLDAEEVSPATLNTIRQFLKDNGIECIGENNDTLNALANRLPFEVVTKDGEKVEASG